ncbi:MAG: type I-F CRISPR-associated protein Csy1 [Pseudomonadota bacterium]
MPDDAILHFFEERKKNWLSKAIKATMSEQEISEQQQLCETVFSLAEWLPKAAKKAGQISMATHPCTFSHPSARKNKNGYVTPILASKAYAADGFIRTGNSAVETDALGNAAALDVYKFLNLTLADGQTLLQHIIDDSTSARELLQIPTSAYEDLKQGFLAILGSDSDLVTSSKIKQVYFPVDSGYHQLSLLTHSGMVYALRKRIDAIRFAEDIKQQRQLRRENLYSSTGYKEIYDITEIAYGGSKPQNISVLNNQNSGRAYLLSSQPPHIKNQTIRFPRSDVFKKSLSHYDCRAYFQRLHTIFLTKKGGKIPLKTLQKARDKVLNEILDYVLETSWGWRSVSAQQFYPESSQLPAAQQIWLCDTFLEKRQKEDKWLQEICEDLILWLERGYMETDNAFSLGMAEKKFFKEWLAQQQEVLR